MVHKHTKTLEAANEAGTPAEVAKKFAHELNAKAKATTVSAETRTALRTLAGDGAGADPNVLLEDTDEHAAKGLKNLAEKIKTNPGALPENIRKETRDKIFKLLNPVVTIPPDFEYDFKASIDSVVEKLKDPEPAHDEHDTKKKPGHEDEAKHETKHEEGEEEEHKSSEVTPGDVARTAVVGGAAAATLATVIGGATHPAGFATGAGTALKAIPGFFSGLPATIWNGLNSFATTLGWNTGANATIPWMSYAPAATAPILAGTLGVLASGRAIRGVRRLLLWARGGKQTDLANLGYGPLTNVAAPVTESVGLIKDVWGMIFGKRDDKGKNGGLVPTIHGATTEPLLNHAGRTLLPKKGRLRTTLFGTVIGGALLGPVGLVAGYLGSNWYSNRPAETAAAADAHAPAAGHDEEHH